jgi:hypothetical protein
MSETGRCLKRLSQCAARGAASVSQGRASVLLRDGMGGSSPPLLQREKAWKLSRIRERETPVRPNAGRGSSCGRP